MSHSQPITLRETPITGRTQYQNAQGTTIPRSMGSTVIHHSFPKFWNQIVSTGSPIAPWMILNVNGTCQACRRLSTLQVQVKASRSQLEATGSQILHANPMKQLLVLDQLIMEEYQARGEVNRCRDPICRLPLEIALHVFRFVLPDFVLRNVENHYDRPPRIRSQVLTLGAVCRAWRRIAWSSPQLWSDMTLILNSELTANKVDVVEKWLERSMPLPLFVRIYVPEQKACDIDYDHWTNLRTFVDAFNRHSARWETFSLQCQNWLAELFTGSEGGSPRLKTLQLSMRYRDDPHTVFEVRGPKPQPNHVVVIEYHHLACVGISWNNAVDVTVYGLPFPDYIHLLTIAPKLVNLRIRILKGLDIDHDAQNLKVVTHRRLRTVDITPPNGVFTTLIETLFDKIKLPSLADLGIHGTSLSLTLPSNNLIAFLDRSFCPLVTLRLHKTSCDRDELLDILHALPPSLENIHLDTRLNRPNQTDHDLPFLFSHLGYTPSTVTGHGTTLIVPQYQYQQSHLLPNLETFTLHVYSTTRIPWNLLPNVLRPGFGKKRPLRELSIVRRDWYGSDPPLLVDVDKGEGLEKSVVEGLVKMKEDGVELFLPRKISFQDLSSWALSDSDSDSE